MVRPALVPLLGGALLLAGCLDATTSDNGSGDAEAPWIEERTDSRLIGAVEVEAHFADLSQWPDEWPAASDFLAENLKADWPEQPTEIYVFQGGFQDAIYQVRFTMSGEQLDAFQESTACDEQIGPVKPLPPADAELDWWTPGDPESLIGCSLGEPGVDRSVQIDTTDPAAPVVYLSAFEF